MIRRSFLVHPTTLTILQNDYKNQLKDEHSKAIGTQNLHLRDVKTVTGIFTCHECHRNTFACSDKC